MTQTKNEAAGLPTNDFGESSSSDSSHILTDFDAAVNRGDADAALQIAGMQTREAADLLRDRFPKLDKTVISKCRKPELYGCRLHEDGFTIIRMTVFGDDPHGEAPQETEHNPGRKHKSGEHRFKCRLSCRLPDEKYEAFLGCIKEDGYATVNDALLTLVLAYIERKRGAHGLVST